MDRGGASRLLLIVGVGLLVFLLFRTFFGGEEGENEKVFTTDIPREWKAPETRAEEKLCTLRGKRFEAQFSTQGASLKRFELLTEKYTKEGKPLDLSTTPTQPQFRQLAFGWRNPAAGKADDPKWNVKADSVDWELTRSDEKSCEFAYKDDAVELTRVVRLNDRPYEVEVTGSIKNLAAEKKTHALVVDTNGWRWDDEVEGGMFRVSPFMTHVECIDADGSAERKTPDEFETDDFEEPGFAANPLNAGEWYQSQSNAVAAVSNFYFSHALVPVSGPAEPACQLRIERWGTPKDARRGHMYRARFAYPAKELAQNETASYTVLSYIGPMERELLASAGGGDKHLDELVDLGFFSIIAKFLVAFLLKVYGFVPNWGFAIIILTICARTLLFPLQIPMIRNSMKMRELKPEMDALNEKYKDDAQAKGLAQMELWRKHNVNPFKGCLPQLASMPVWFALYTTLQRSVELYNIPFLWFPDLSESDPYFVLPFVIGGVFYLQQLLMPMQGDPAQQKMMRYVMPGMFTVFMLFLPSGLGVYMFTNSLLGIAQQQLVEWRVRRKTAKSEISVKVKDDDEGDSGKKPGGSSKPRGKKKGRKVTESGPLLDKGKA